MRIRGRGAAHRARWIMLGRDNPGRLAGPSPPFSGQPRREWVVRDGVLVSEVRMRGPLAEYAVGFAESLAGRGYTAGSVRPQVHLVAQLSRWLDAEGLEVVGLTELSAERFIVARAQRRAIGLRAANRPLPLAAILDGGDGSCSRVVPSCHSRRGAAQVTIPGSE
jgi:hypothetical protein